MKYLRKLSCYLRGYHQASITITSNGGCRMTWLIHKRCGHCGAVQAAGMGFGNPDHAPTFPVIWPSRRKIWGL